MLFTSFTYVLFLCVVLPLVRRTEGVWRERVLLGASLIYYAAWDVRFLAVLLALGVFTYLAGRRIVAARAHATKPPFATATAPVVAILVVLAFFKYTHWLVELENALFETHVTLPKIVLPLGISFFTFECVSYLIDVQKGGAELLPLRRFLLFPAYWPHMVAGPILRVKELALELDKLQRPTWRETVAGIDRMVVGLVKKVVFADSLAVFVDQGFGATPGTVGGLDAWALTVAFALQIFFDFSGYSDIALGVSRMVGIRMPENFNLPYHAESPSDFWNRWHMTLSRWIRDYLFFPLNLKAGRRVWLRYVFLFMVMTLVGLWHGAGAGFLVWGAWHGGLMVAHRILQNRVGRLEDGIRIPLERLGQGLALVLIVAGWVPFRAPTLAATGALWRAMATLRGLRPAYSINDYLLVFACMVGYFALSPKVERFVQRDPQELRTTGLRFWARAPLYALAVQLLFMFDRSNVAFLYFQF